MSRLRHVQHGVLALCVLATTVKGWTLLTAWHHLATYINLACWLVSVLTLWASLTHKEVDPPCPTGPPS